jgi:hypothetical protein
MSETGIVSLSTADEKLSTSFAGLVDRLSQHGTIREVFIQDETMRRTTLESDTLRNNTQELVKTLSGSRNKLVVETTLDLPLGGTLEVEITLIGKAHFQGWTWIESGSTSISFQMRSLFESDANRNELCVGGDRDAPDSISRMKSNAEWLFLLACGFEGLVPPDGSFDHAAMHIDGAWPTPIECSMIFHRQAYQLRRDFRRIAVCSRNLRSAFAYKRSANMQTLFRHDAELDREALRSQVIQALSPTQREVYKELANDFGDRLGPFLEKLSIDGGMSLASGDLETLLSAFAKACRQQSRFEMRIEQDKGVAITARPSLDRHSSYGYLWPIYSSVAEQFWAAVAEKSHPGSS